MPENPEIEEEIFHCIRCNKELHVSDFFFKIWLDVKQDRDYGVHASCLKAHHDAIVKRSEYYYLLDDIS